MGNPVRTLILLLSKIDACFVSPTTSGRRQEWAIGPDPSSPMVPLPGDIQMPEPSFFVPGILCASIQACSSSGIDTEEIRASPNSYTYDAAN